jgi:hypothetical protein
MKVDNKKLHLILLSALGVMILLFFAITFKGLSLLSSKSQQLLDLKVQSQTADAQLSNLEQTKKDVEKYSYFKNIAATVIPNDKNQAQAVLELNQMAAQSGINLQNITFPTSNLGGVKTKSSAAASSPATAISQAQRVPGIAGLYSLQLTVTADNSKTLSADRQVTFPKILDFLNRIQNSRRTAQITQVNIQPATNTQTLNLSLIINIFIKP